MTETRTSAPGTRTRETAAAGTFYALVAQLSSAACTAAVTVVLVRVLGPQQYGELALVLSVGGITLVLADAAVAQSTGRDAAAHADDPERLAAVVSSGLRVKLVVTSVAALALVGLAGPIAAAYGAPAMTWALRAVALAVVAESLVLLWVVTLQAVRRVAVTVRLLLLEGLAEAAAVLSLVAAGAGITGAVLGRAVGYGVGAVVGAALLVRVLGRWPDARGEPELRRRIGAYARPLLVNTGAYSAYRQADVQLVALLLDRASVGVYAAPARLLVLLTHPGQAVANAVSPRMAGPSPDVHSFTTALRWLVVYQTALMAPVVLWAEPITVLLLGRDYLEAADVLVALAPYLWLSGVSVLASTTVNYLGHARRRIPVVLLALALDVGLAAVLLPRVGVVGAAIALSLSYAVYVPLHARICRQSFPLPLRPLARTLARCTVAGAVSGTVLVLIGTGDLSWRQWLLGAALGPASYVATLVALRELTGDDVRSVRTAARDLAHRLRARDPDATSDRGRR